MSEDFEFQLEDTDAAFKVKNKDLEWAKKIATINLYPKAHLSPDEDGLVGTATVNPRGVYPQSIGLRLRALRLERALNKKSTAKALGAELNTYYAWEHGQRWIALDIIAKIAEHYNVRLDFLVQGDMSILTPGSTKPDVARRELLSVFLKDGFKQKLFEPKVKDPGPQRPFEYVQLMLDQLGPDEQSALIKRLTESIQKECT